ncbi:ISL3 family transposase [Streptosporangium sp. CA-115845]|uniref:ISL3 family transposase n=1 Tax=Streptosporangium sp. CA-115845 TaxID=3240071 RepID=UPI003D8F3739
MLHEVSSDQARLLGMLFPHLDGLEFVGVRAGDAGLVVVARTAPEPMACRGCGTPSSRLHERYRRRLEDMSCAGRPVRVELEVRRLCCLNADCAVVTFAEQVEGVTQWRQRRTPGLRHVLERVGLALAGRAGARLAAVLGAVVSRCTMLRLIRALPDPEVGTVRVLGVDEFAKRRGQSYATILIDLDTHRPVDVLDGREAQPLADWLAAHPGVGIVCRDRAGGFAEGARLGAPDARQCADRWHLYNNLCVVVDKTIRANRADLREPIPAGDGQDAPEASGTGTTAAAQNNADTQISEPLEEAGRTGAEDLLPSAEASARLHNFIPYLRKRILDDRCANAALLFQELREHGYQGSARTLRRYLVPFRDELAARKLPSVPLSGPSTVSVADRTRQRHAEIHALLAQGFNQTQICQITGLSEQTVKKFRRAATADELLGDPGNQYRLFERFVPYLRKRVIEDGCDNAALLCRELRDQGYRGSTRTIRRYLVPLRAGLHGPDLPPKPPSVRDVRRWITSDPDHLTDDDKDHLAAILDRSQPLAALDQHVTTFAKMLIHRTGERDLDDWLTAVDTETTDLPHLRSFAQGLRRDHTAVLNGLSLPYSSGAVEGENCKIKHLKRIMFGRANLDLLRTMILHN